MNVGDQVTIPFGKGQKEGVVVRTHDKHVWLKVDFPRHSGKLIKRKIHQLSARGGKRKTRKTR